MLGHYLVLVKMVLYMGRIWWRSNLRWEHLGWVGRCWQHCQLSLCYTSSTAHTLDRLVAGYGNNYLTSPIKFGACLCLLALRRLHAYNVDENGQNEATELLAELPKGNSPVQEIELRSSKLYFEDFQHMLQAAKALKTFIYEVGRLVSS